MRPALAILILAAGLAACTARGPRSSGGSARIVQPADLPERQREILEAWRRGGASWEVERGRVAQDPELSGFLVDNLIVEMVRSFDRSAIATAAQPNAPFDRAQAELVRFQDRSTPVLAELLEVHDGIVAFLAADTLKRIGPAAVAPAVGKLGSAEPEVRRRAAELLAELPNSPEIEPAVLERLGERVEGDEAWIVRAQAARALGARGSRHEHKGYAAAVLTRALGDSDAEVVESALAGLATLGEPSAVPALIQRMERAAREGDLAGLHAAQAALRLLLHEDSDHDPDGWWELWQKRAASIRPNASRTRD